MGGQRRKLTSLVVCVNQLGLILCTAIIEAVSCLALHRQSSLERLQSSPPSLLVCFHLARTDPILLDLGRDQMALVRRILSALE